MTEMGEVLRHLHRAGILHDAGKRTDGQLLESFISHRDSDALDALVRRHAPMVWGVCRRVLRNHHDAEDAFQAAFLVLVRKASSIAPREMVGNWLYGVAYQTALKARATAAKRVGRERQVANMPDPATQKQDCNDELLAVLDLELSRLPDIYRSAIVLCELEGQTRKTAARQLGVPDGTLAARVSRGRTLLARRLARHGLAVSGGTLMAVMSQNEAPACVPAAVLSATIKVANLLAAGQAAGVIAAPVAALTEGVLKTMLVTKMKTALGICLAVALLVIGSAFGYRTLAGDVAAPEPPKDRLADTLILLDKQWWEATSNHDVDTMSKILADDWVGVTPDCPQTDWTKAMSLGHFRQRRYFDVKLLKERRVVRIDEHTAMMSYEARWRAGDKDKGSPAGWNHARVVHCWVQRDGGWFVKYTECVNLPVPAEWSAPPAETTTPVKPGTAWKKGVRASGFWQTEIPENAFDGKGNTDWNAGDYAPAWIERDLGARRPLAGITLIPCQDIPGATVHEIWVSDEPIGNDRKKAKLVHTFKGETTNRQELKFEFPKELSARYVEVLTTQSPTWIAWVQIEIRVREENVIPLDSGRD
jgi:RNA polymerase sigma factor (sigma-70 family)